MQTVKKKLALILNLFNTQSVKDKNKTGIKKICIVLLFYKRNLHAFTFMCFLTNLLPELSLYAVTWPLTPPPLCSSSWNWFSSKCTLCTLKSCHTGSVSINNLKCLKMANTFYKFITNTFSWEIRNQMRDGNKNRLTRKFLQSYSMAYIGADKIFL